MQTYAPRNVAIQSTDPFVNRDQSSSFVTESPMTSRRPFHDTYYIDVMMRYFDVNSNSHFVSILQHDYSMSMKRRHVDAIVDSAFHRIANSMPN